MSTVEATTMVEFGSVDPSDVKVTFELDETLNEGLSVEPGVVLYLCLQLSEGVSVGEIVTTSGSVSYEGEVSYDTTEDFEFFSREEVDTHTLAYIPTGGVDFDFYGRDATVSTNQLANKEVSVSIDPEDAPCIAKASYKYKCLSYKLNTPSVVLEDDEHYQVAVVVYLSQEESDDCSL